MSVEQVERAIAVFRGANWHVVPRTDARELELSDPVRARYPVLDPGHAELLRRVKSCVDRDRLTWFLCEDDYAGTSSWPIRWNEWEMHASEITIGMRENAQRAVAFWTSHIPIIGTLRAEYAYVVLRPDSGGVFCGEDPEGTRLESVGSFGELLDAVTARVRGEPAPGWTARFF